MLKSLIDQDVHDLFQRKLRDRTLMKDPNFKWCYKVRLLYFVYCRNSQTFLFVHYGTFCVPTIPDLYYNVSTTGTFRAPLELFAYTLELMYPQIRTALSHNLFSFNLQSLI